MCLGSLALSVDTSEFTGCKASRYKLYIYKWSAKLTKGVVLNKDFCVWRKLFYNSRYHQSLQLPVVGKAISRSVCQILTTICLRIATGS